MAFELIQKGSPGSNGGRLVGKASYRPIGETNAQMSIAGDLAKQLGFKAGSRVHVSRGTGSDAGFLSVRSTTDINGRKLVRPGHTNAAPLFGLAASVLGVEVPSHAVRLPAFVRDDMVVIDIHPLMSTETQQAA